VGGGSSDYSQSFERVGSLRSAYAYPYPDLLTFHDAPTTIEQRLFEMHLKHRMRAFQGTFHANPDYAHLVWVE